MANAKMLKSPPTVAISWHPGPGRNAFISLGTTGSAGSDNKSASGAASVARLTEDDYQFYFGSY